MRVVRFSIMVRGTNFIHIGAQIHCIADQKRAVGLNVTFKKHIKPCASIEKNRMKRQLLFILKMLVTRPQFPSRGLGMDMTCQAIPRYIHYRAFLIIKDCLKKQRDEGKIREN